MVISTRWVWDGMTEDFFWSVFETIIRIRKRTPEEYIKSLIGRMARVEKNFTSSSTSISWHAYRAAEKLKSPEYYPILKKFILSDQDHERNEKEIREAYFIMGKLLGKVSSDEYCKFYIQQLEKETDIDIIACMLDRLSEISISSDIDINPVVVHSQSDKWLVRHSAIKALGSSDRKESRDALAYYLNQANERKYRYEIYYAASAIAEIGEVEDISMLEKHLDSRDKDIRYSSEFAIEKIRGRHNCSVGQGTAGKNGVM